MVKHKVHEVSENDLLGFGSDLALIGLFVDIYCCQQHENEEGVTEGTASHNPETLVEVEAPV